MNTTRRKWLIGVCAVLAIGGWKYASESEMRRLDKEVDRLCAIDGRSVIYETVKMPADRFNEHGQSKVPYGKDEIGFGYYYKLSSESLAGPGQAPGARLMRDHYRVVRVIDSKVIAEHILYARSGGQWLEGVPGVGRGKLCPGPVPMNFNEQVFAKE
jgi:hypothetical protein